MIWMGMGMIVWLCRLLCVRVMLVSLRCLGHRKLRMFYLEILLNSNMCITMKESK